MGMNEKLAFERIAGYLGDLEVDLNPASGRALATLLCWLEASATPECRATAVEAVEWYYRFGWRQLCPQRNELDSCGCDFRQDTAQFQDMCPGLSCFDPEKWALRARRRKDDGDALPAKFPLYDPGDPKDLPDPEDERAACGCEGCDCSDCEDLGCECECCADPEPPPVRPTLRRVAERTLALTPQSEATPDWGTEDDDVPF